MKEKKYLLVLNSGSSSLKFSLFEFQHKTLGQEYISGQVTRAHQGCDFVYHTGLKTKKIHYSTVFSIKTAWHYIHDLLAKLNIVYVGFRVVHGGEYFKETVKINQEVLQKIAKYNHLAPLHNPPALELINLVRRTWPRLPLAASFDTAWYSSMRPEQYLYALPLKYYRLHGIRKYGFHGLNHERCVEWAGQKIKKPLSQLEVISCQLGSGNSVTWYARGKVMDTSMGYAPNEGLLMSTRSGDLPPDVILYLSGELKMSIARIKELLNQESGLVGLAGTADLREILLANGYRVAGFRSSWKFSNREKKLARLALYKYIYSIRRYIAAYAGQARHLDALVFAGPVGSNPVIRKLVLQNLNLPKYTKILLAEGDENYNIAVKTWRCLH